MKDVETMTRFRNHEEDPWHDFDLDEGTAKCGVQPLRTPGTGTYWAVAEVDPQPFCTDCKDST